MSQTIQSALSVQSSTNIYAANFELPDERHPSDWSFYYRSSTHDAAPDFGLRNFKTFVGDGRRHLAIELELIGRAIAPGEELTMFATVNWGVEAYRQG